MSDYIYLEDDSDNFEDSSLQESGVQLHEVTESLKELFDVKRELDDVFESVINELMDIFRMEEIKHKEDIITLQQENAVLKQIIDDLNKKLANNIN
jgi:hypothetical protein